MSAIKRTYKICGILNLTPDSFSDGGQFMDEHYALDHCQKLLSDGADFVDIGAESTRPGASEIGEETEWTRLFPILNRFAKKNLITSISVDTRKPEIMRRVVDMGVSFINCVGPLPSQSNLANLFSKNKNLSFIACHMHGSPATMQVSPIGPSSARRRVAAYFEESTAELIDAGCNENNIYVDPGIGFGKTDAANWGLLLDLARFSKNYRIAIGISRKGFIGRAVGGESPKERDPASKILEVVSAMSGASLVRTHDVASLLNFESILCEAKT